MSESVARRIDDHAAYVAESSGDPDQALYWIQLVFQEAESLSTFPRRCPLAIESAIAGFEVRQLRVGGRLLLFRIDDDAEVVHVVWLRHAAQRPGPFPTSS